MSAVLNFDLIDDHERGFAAVMQELEVIGLEMEAISADVLDREKVNVDGTLKKSIGHEVTAFKREVATLIFGANADHAPFIEFGTVPHFPPVAPLEEWVRKKLPEVPAEEISSAAFLIARKISIEGTEAVGFIEEALDEIKNKFAERLEAAYVLGFNNLF